MRPDLPASDTVLVAGIFFWTLLHRMNEERVGYQAERNSPSTRPFLLTDASEISTLCQGVVAGRMQGVALPACSLVYLAGPSFGIWFEPTLFDGEFARIARMRGRAHISADNLIPDFGQFRTTLQSFSRFLADREVVTFGPGNYRICLFREEIYNISDLFARMEGVTNPNDRIAQLTPDPTKIFGETDILRVRISLDISNYQISL